MNPAALFGALAFIGAAWWYSRPDAGAAQLELVPGGDSPLWSDFGATFAPFAALPDQLTFAAESVVDNVVQAVTPGGWQLPAAGEPYRALIEAAEDRRAIPRMMLGRLLWQESHFRADIISGAKRSSAGALGIAQFMPATAAELRVDPLDVAQAIDGAGRYLRSLYDQTGTWRDALAAYNGGIGNLQRRGLDGMAQETRDYVRDILGDLGLA